MKKIEFATITSILIGTILEWYDFSLLGAMTPIISKLFFPAKTPLVSLLSTFAVFASGFLMRPLGGILFGHIGDRYGRKTALSLSILLMALPTAMIGLLPVYATVGIMAPVLLVILRLIQGISASGEYPGAICFLTEIAPTNQKGLFGSISMFGVAGGILLSSIMSMIFSTYLSTDQMSAWGWRIPFLISLPLGIIGWYLRCKVKESIAFENAKKDIFKLPLTQLFKFNFLNLNKVIFLFALSTSSFYLGFVYIVTYLVSLHKITFSQALFSNTLSTTILIICMPLFGYLSDRTNRKMIMLMGASALLILSYPIFMLFLSNNPHGLLQGQILLAISIAMLVGPMAATTSELFSTLIRYSGISIGLNVGTSIFGGACPLIATYLVTYSQKASMPCLLPISLAFLCLIIIFSLSDTSCDNKPL